MFYFLLFLITVLICWASWVYTLFAIDPLVAGFLGILFFYLSLFLAAGGTFVFISYFLRKKINPSELPGVLFKVSIRQGLFISFVLVGLLYFLSQNMLRWWNGSLFVLIFVIIEAFFLSKKKIRLPPLRPQPPGDIIKEETKIK